MKKCLFTLIIVLLYSCENELFIDKSKDPEYNFDSFWNEVDRHYPFFSYTNLNWDSVYSVYRSKITPTTPDSVLFNTYTQMLDLLGDIHSNIYAPMGTGGNTTLLSKYPSNQILLNSATFVTYTTGKVFEYGMLKNHNIGYIKIKTFQYDKTYFQEIDTILDIFKSTIGIIIDVRSNQGGILSNSLFVASCFTDQRRLIAKYRVRNGSKHTDFSDWNNLYISPSETKNHYYKPVAVLTNRLTFSAAEWFVLSIHEIPKITVIGDTTGGGSSAVFTRELPNSWILRISNWQTLSPSGNDFQFTGIYPDIPVWISNEDVQKNRDTILERAITELE